MLFRIDPERQSGFAGDGQIEKSPDGRLVWHVPEAGELRYDVRLDHRRPGSDEFDARMTSTFALFRGEDLFPGVSTTGIADVETDATLEMDVPEGWSIAARYPRRKDGLFEIEQTHRFLDRPTGWILAGKLGSARETVDGVKVLVASPKKQDPHRLDLLAFLRWTLPELVDLFPSHPERFLIVRAGDPMWRGGLSGPGSFYLHAERPLIDLDGTSPVLHELMHCFMHARAGKNGDWIVEGLAELYSVELLRRSGAIGKRRFERTLARLAKKGKSAPSILVKRADGAVAARAVGVLLKLGQEIRRATGSKRSLDDVVRALEKERQAVTPAGLRSVAEKIAGKDLGSFFHEEVGE
jgi:predicted metalloprotease with PDZ domain